MDRQLADRKKFLDAIAKFAVPLAREFGIRKDHVVYDCYTSGKMVLEGFHNFTIIHQGAYSMFGGEGLEIWYHPGRVTRPGTMPTLDFDWWNEGDYKVKRFDLDKKWQRALRKLTQNAEDAKRTFLAQRARLKRRAEKAATRQVEEQQGNERRAQEAERLGFAATK